MKATLERRDDPRVAAHSAARMEAPNAVFTQAGPALIEEIGACGLRLRSEVQLHRDEDLVLKIKGEPLPLHARVVWVREDPPVHLGAHKTWLAGCQFHGDSIARAKLIPDLGPQRTIFLGRRVILIAGVIGLAAVLVYLYLRFAMLVGGGALH